MIKLAQVLDEHRHADVAEPRRSPHRQHLYYAFLSYSHQDEAIADWLHDELEQFKVPHNLVGRLTVNGIIPHRLAPIFRDRHELAAADDLATEIKAALASSRFLIVMCSPASARSHWTNTEIEYFKRTHPEGCVLAVIIDGEPFASELPGREDEECFSPALRQKYDRRGRPTNKRAEPLAADLRESGDGRRMGLLKLVAGMLGVGLDELVQRDATRRHRRLAWLAAASLAGMAVTSTLAFTAIRSRDEAREQRREAEGLIGFMLGGLRDKLEPIGRLDALDGVAGRVLSYYRKEDTSGMSDAALSQRSRALSLMAEVATKRGDVDGALRLYHEAMAGTAEAVRRKPAEPQALFDHAQNVFYIGDAAKQRGDYKTAERYLREYKRLAVAMVGLAPDNMKWRMEVQYADADLGALMQSQRRFTESATQFQEALNTIQAISTADPSNLDYRKSVAESLAWLADARQAVGQYDAAIAARQRDIALLDGLLAKTGDVDFQERLMPARRALGELYAERGQSADAIKQFRAAIGHGAALNAIEPGNAQWLEYGYWARFSLSRQLLLTGQMAEAAQQTQAGCRTVQALLKRNASNPAWRKGMSRCMILTGQLALQEGAKARALSIARQSLPVARSVHTDSTLDDAFVVAKSYLFLGDAQRGLGNMEAARTAWTQALAAIPPGVAERPEEAADHAKILLRLGREAEAKPLESKLKAIGYRAD